MVVIHPKMKLQPQYLRKAISARQTLLRNPSRTRTDIRGWGRVFEGRRKGAILRGDLISLVEGPRKAICSRYYSASVAMTKAVWALVSASAVAVGLDRDRILETVLAHSKGGRCLDFRNRLFCVPLGGVGPRETVTLKIVAYPGDLGCTVYTLMLPLEK